MKNNSGALMTTSVCECVCTTHTNLLYTQQHICVCLIVKKGFFFGYCVVVLPYLIPVK